MAQKIDKYVRETCIVPEIRASWVLEDQAKSGTAMVIFELPCYVWLGHVIHVQFLVHVPFLD